jgi:hypothetical protein
MDFVFSLLEVALKALATALVKYAVSRTKEKTAPSANRDGSKDKD